LLRGPRRRDRGGLRTLQRHPRRGRSLRIPRPLAPLRRADRALLPRRHRARLAPRRPGHGALPARPDADRRAGRLDRGVPRDPRAPGRRRLAMWSRRWLAISAAALGVAFAISALLYVKSRAADLGAHARVLEAIGRVRSL